MGKKDRILLSRIIEESAAIIDYVDGYDCQAFIDDERTQKAVCMTLINIGEKVKNLTSEIKVDNNQIDWRSIMVLRNIAAHNYDSLNMDEIWVVASVDIPVLFKEAKEILKSHEKQG